MCGEEADSPDYGQVTCGACHQTMVPRFVSDSVYPQLGHLACIYCGSMVRRREATRGDSKPENRRIPDIILIGVVATPVVVAVIAIVLYLL